MDFLLRPDPGLMFWTAISFAILVIILKKYAWKPILRAVNVRKEGIENSLLEAEKAKKEVEKLNVTKQEIINAAKVERNKLLKEASTLKDDIILEARTKAQAEADKIIDKARKQISVEKANAIKELKNKVAELSVDIAGKLIEKELNTNSKQKELIDKYLKEVNFN